MSEAISPSQKAKFICAKRAMGFVEPGMRLGLGTGSTAAWLVRLLGDEVRNNGLKITTVATSVQTARLAAECGITVCTMDDVKWLDLTIDGADEFDPELNLIKGGGAALLQEKIVATASDRMVVIADASKDVDVLGRFPLPVEVVQFGWASTEVMIKKAIADLDVGGQTVTQRMNGDTALITDEGHYILDLHLERIGDPQALSLILNQIPGVVETGLFLDIADAVVIGHVDGRVEVRDGNTGTAAFETIDITDADNMLLGI
ncbi:MAG: ribose-5-phosphate isomerase RpiA [Proteobacteria bacterium]|nr:ribose-5-phosphate isomerase RpiA [Pseudomonadota bacterium]